MATYNSGAAKISIPIMNEAGMAMISYANTYPGLTKASRAPPRKASRTSTTRAASATTCAPCPRTISRASAGANWAFETQGVRKAYVLDDQSLYGQGVAQVFNTPSRRWAAKCSASRATTRRRRDYQALMTKIADMGPDIVYVGATVDNNAPKLFQDMRSLMPADEVIFMGPDGLINQAFIDGAGDAAEGAYITFAGFPPDALTGRRRRLRDADQRDPRPRAGRLRDLRLRVRRSSSSRRSTRSRRRTAARSWTP